MFSRSIFSVATLTRGVHRYVAPTLREIRRRKKILPVPQNARSEFLEWNYEAEIFACGQRLRENIEFDLLRRAFVHRSFAAMDEDKKRELGIFTEANKLKDNNDLIRKGEELIKSCTTKFLERSLPDLPEPGTNSVLHYLTSVEMLSNLCSNLGMEELILCSDSMKTNYTLSDTFKAVVGALAESSGDNVAAIFIQDVVCAQLSQKDLSEHWIIEKPVDLLHQVCESRKLGKPEPRLIGEAGRNTILSTYHVGIYLNKSLLGSGYGENIVNAEEIAAKNCLSKMFGIDKPFTFKALDGK